MAVKYNNEGKVTSLEIYANHSGIKSLFEFLHPEEKLDFETINDLCQKLQKIKQEKNLDFEVTATNNQLIIYKNNSGLTIKITSWWNLEIDFGLEGVLDLFLEICKKIVPTFSTDNWAEVYQESIFGLPDDLFIIGDGVIIFSGQYETKITGDPHDIFSLLQWINQYLQKLKDGRMSTYHDNGENGYEIMVKDEKIFWRYENSYWRSNRGIDHADSLEELKTAWKDMIDQRGISILLDFIYQGYQEKKDMVGFILDQDLDFNNQTYQTTEGTTMLHEAIDVFADKELLELLISKGLNINGKNNDGQTPLAFLKEKKTDILSRTEERSPKEYKILQEKFETMKEVLKKHGAKE